MYTFKLEALLEHRKYVEDTLQRELSDIKRRLSEEEKKLGQMIRKEEDMSVKLRQLQEESVSSQDMIMYQKFLVRLADELKQQKRKIFSVEKSHQKKRNEVVEAMKNRKALEKLKENGMKAYTEKLLKKEKAFVDEVAVMRFNHNR